MDRSDTIRVLIVDDHEMVRRGLAVFLQVFPDLELVGDTGSGEEALRLIETLHPDVVLMDLLMPGVDGVSATRSIRTAYPHTQVIALSSFADEHLVHSAMEAGAVGYLTKNASIDELANAIRSAHSGKPTLAPEALRSLIGATTRKPSIGQDLTDREREVLALIVEGLTNSEIAAALFVSQATVKTHVSNILAKLNASSRTEAATLAIQNRLVASARNP